MPKIAIITDTDCSLPVEIAKQYQIHQVPINIHFGSDHYAAVETMTDQQLFERVDRQGKLPTTSAPSPGMFLKAYEAAFDEGSDELICFTVSSKVSAVYNAAVTAREMLPEKAIRVVDTESLSMGQGFMVLTAAQAVQENLNGEQVIARAFQTGKRVRLFAALSTLKYLAMSGRVGHLAVGIAGLLDVRPILTLKDWKLDLLERARTQMKAWTRVVELSKESLGGKAISRLAFLHVNAQTEANQFMELFCERIACPADSITAELTPGLSVHSGAGVVGVSFLVGD